MFFSFCIMNYKIREKTLSHANVARCRLDTCLALLGNRDSQKEK